MSRDGQTLVCCVPMFLRVYQDGNWTSGRELESCKRWKHSTVTAMAVSDDASAVMAAESDRGELALFDVKNDKLVKKWKSPDECWVYVILAFHGRNWFASGDDAGEIKVWDDKGNLRATLKVKGNNQPVAALAISRDNRFLASSGEGRPVVVWDLRAILGGK